MEKLQTLFLSVLLAVPLSCARPALAWDTETLSMENRVAQRKLNFVCHLKRLGENLLAKQVYQEQLKHEWPGLVSEIKELCKNLRLEDINRKKRNRVKALKRNLSGMQLKRKMGGSWLMQ